MKKSNSLKKKQTYCMITGMAIGASLGSVGFAFTSNIMVLPLCASAGMSLGMIFSAREK